MGAAGTATKMSNVVSFQVGAGLEQTPYGSE